MENITDMAPPEDGELFGRHPRGRFTRNINAAVTRRQNTAQNGQERRLATARWSHQQGQFTTLQGNADALQGTTRTRTFAVDVDDVSGFD